VGRSDGFGDRHLGISPTSTCLPSEKPTAANRSNISCRKSPHARTCNALSLYSVSCSALCGAAVAVAVAVALCGAAVAVAVALCGAAVAARRRDRDLALHPAMAQLILLLAALIGGPDYISRCTPPLAPTICVARKDRRTMLHSHRGPCCQRHLPACCVHTRPRAQCDAHVSNPAQWRCRVRP
jgi:hypothetical protein